MTAEDSIRDHETAGLQFWEDVFFSDADLDTTRLSQSSDCTGEKCTILDDIEYGKNLISQSFAMLAEKVGKSRNTVHARIRRRTKS